MNGNEPFSEAKDHGDRKALLASAMEMMRDTYYRIACIDLLENSMETIEIAKDELKDEEGFKKDFGKNIREFAEEYVLDEYRATFLNVMAPERIEELFDSGLRYVNIIYRRYESGSPRWVRTELIPMQDYSPKRKRVMWYVKNIHEEQALEEKLSDKFIRMNTDINLKLKNTDTILNQIVRMMNNGILAYGIPDYGIIVLNDEAKRLFDWHEKELKSFVFSDVVLKNIVPEDIPTVREAASKVKNPGDKAEYEFRLVHKDGKRIKLHVVNAMHEFSDGKRFILSSIQDVTEQAMLNDIIREERAQYRDALTAGCIYAFTADLTDGIIYERDLVAQGINLFKRYNISSGCIMFDSFVKKWINGRNPKFLGGASEKSFERKSLAEKFAQGEKTVEMEYYDPVADMYVRTNILLSENIRSGNIMAFIYGTDITEARKEEELARQALVEAYEAAKKANSAKSDFLSKMSHDIRTPMNAVMGMTAIAAANLDDREKVANCLDNITLSSEYLLSLLNNILDMSKIESGRLDLEESEFSLKKLTEDTVTIIRPWMKTKKHKFRLDISGIEHENVIGDETRLRQVFLNMISNAGKYTPEGGIISFSISEKPLMQHKIACFECVFEDNGIGISPEYAEHIFEPFTREADSRVSKIGGAGLGMAITGNLIRMMNGSIEIESAPGKGSKFTISIPMRLQDSGNSLADRPAERLFRTGGETPSYPGKRILLAEDNDLNAEITTEILRMMKVETERAENGQIAVEMLASSEEGYYQLVLMDIQMPVMNGNDAARAIRAMKRSDAATIPIVAVTANAFSDDIQAAFSAGMNGHLAKPLNIKLLTDVLDIWLK